MADDSGRKHVSAPAASEMSGEQAPRGTITLLTEVSCTRLVMAGEVDVSMNADLFQAVEAAALRGLSVEVLTEDVISIDTAVIGMLAHLANLLDRPLRFVAPPAVVRSLLNLTGIADAVEISGQEPGLSPDTGPAVTPT